METGKLPIKLLERLIKNVKTSDDVITGPQIGMDAAKIKTKSKNFVIGADPITFECENVGKYAVSVNANDIAVSGAIPKFFMSTILLPPNTCEQDASFIFNEVLKSCRELNISLIGGHTEITDSVTRPIVSGTMIGEEVYKLEPEKAYNECDIVLINKPCIEGTCILANSAKNKLINAGINKNKLDYAKNLINTQGICVYPMVNELFKLIKKDNSLKIYYMHDPTEGGIASALEELSKAIKKGLYIENIEFMDECLEFCNVFDLNPMGLISSGSLLLVSNKGKIIEEHFNKINIYCKIIGKVYDSKVIYKNGNKYNFSRDEIVRFFELNKI